MGIQDSIDKFYENLGGVDELLYKAIKGFGDMTAGVFGGIKDAVINISESIGISGGGSESRGASLPFTGETALSPTPTPNIPTAPSVEPLLSMEQIQQNAQYAYQALPDSVKSMVDAIRDSSQSLRLADANSEAFTQVAATTPALISNNVGAALG